MTEPVKPVPDGYHTVTPYLIVDDADGVIAFAQRAFDAELMHRSLGPDGGVMHAEIRIGDSRVMLGQANAQWPAMPAMLHLYVPDVDTVYRRALGAGARSVREPATQFYGDRSGGVADAAGNQWWIATRVEDVPPEEIARRAVERATDAPDGAG
jgi:PhnB protein